MFDDFVHIKMRGAIMYNKKNIFVLLIFILLSVFITQPSNYMLDNFKENQVNEKTIYAPKYVKYKDEILSNQLIEEAKSKVQKVYNSDKTLYENVSKDLKDFTESLKEQNKFIRSEVAKSESDSKISKTFNSDSFTQAELKKVKNPFHFSLDELLAFYKLDAEEIDIMTDAYDNELKIAFDNTIDQNNLEAVRRSFSNSTNFYFLNKEIRSSMTKKLKERIVINLTFNEKETNIRIKDALSKVEPVYREIQKGELIVRQGELLTNVHIEKLKHLGLIKTKINFNDMLRMLPYNLFLFLVFHVYIFKFHGRHFKNIKQYTFLLSSVVFAILLTNVIKDSSLFLIPILTILMLFVVFWGRSLTLFASLILGMLINVGDYEYLLLVLFSGIFLSLFFKDRGNRIDLILSGILVGIGLAIIYSIFSVLFDSSITSNKLIYIAYIILSSFTSSLLTMGFIPLFETMLGLVTSLKLHELYNPNHPLLKRLIREAPGTYHHSLMVGNLAETAAEEIGADGLLLRVGAFFHDVGKLKNPEFFIENTTPSRNPHDNIEPIESAKIIKRHPIDGVEMCKKYNLPEPILQLVLSHHGDSVVRGFYNKEKKNNPNVKEEDYRYTTPTPKTKEEGILLLADTVEAYSRTITNKPKEEFEKLIKDIIYSKVNEGVLRDCDLSLKDIDTIVYTFINHLSTSNHERISYEK